MQINRDVFFNSLANAGRSLVNPLFIAAISYLFIRGGSPEELQSINEIGALVNLFLVFSGWGLKDYLVKESAKISVEFKASWHLAFSSKLVLLVPLLFIFACAMPGEYVIFIGLVAGLRTYNTLYEPLIILYKKNLFFFLFDFLAALILVLLIALGQIRSFVLLFILLAVSEALKTLFCYFIFRLPAAFNAEFRTLILFLKDTRFYFLLVLVSFFQSRIDLYLLGFLFRPEKLNEYQLLSSLISLSQVVVASFVVSYSKLLYRNIGFSMQAFRKLLFRSGSIVALISCLFIYIILNELYRFHFNWLKTLITAWNILAFSWTLYEMYYYTKQDWLHRTLLFLLISGLFNLSLSVFLIPPLGITGALTANTSAMSVLGILMTWRRTRANLGTI